jgi:L-threonylcarbamoyladenylate synthase
VPDEAHALAQRFWPGPLTLILRRAAHVSDLVTGGQDTVGLRVPAHPLARALLDAFGGGLAAPSANRYGHVSPTTAQHVREEFGDEVPIVLDGGPCAIGIESTIVDLSGCQPRMLRPGRIARADIEAAIGALPELPSDDAPRTPGSTKSHYAPRTPVELVDRASLAQRAAEARADGAGALVLAIASMPAGCEGLVLPADADGYARHLYAALRRLDAEGADRIVIERPPRDAQWLAIGDRLQRAAAGAADADDAGP